MTVITNPITEIAVNGTPISLGLVEWNLTITHSRQDISQGPTPSTALFSLLLDLGDTIPVNVADTVTIKASGVIRFTGTVTGMDLTHLDTVPGVTPITRVTVGAVGNLAKLDTFTDGLTGYTEQSFTDRAYAILDTTGLTYQVNSDSSVTLLSEAAGDVRSVAELLGALCETVGATMADLPDGIILLETYTQRATNYDGTSWTNTTGTWADNTQAWQTTRTTWTLPTTAVEWAPTWGKRLDTVINSAVVSYGTADPQATVSSTDATSISTYGTKDVYLATKLKNSSDATTRAGAILTAQATARWNIPDATVFLDLLDAGDLTAALNIETGDRVILTGLPNLSPTDPYLGIVEGWTETITPEGHRLTLHLSDPRYSFAMAQWSDISGSKTWSAAVATWSDVVLASNI